MKEKQGQTNASEADDWAAAMAEQSEQEALINAKNAGRGDVSRATEARVSQAGMQPLHAAADGGGEDRMPPNLESILDIPVTLAVEIGSTKVSIRNLLQLNQGSVVELDRLAGEPLDVLVNGTLVAHGEVVVVNEKFGIRLTDVISAQERVKKLR